MIHGLETTAIMLKLTNKSTTALMNNKEELLLLIRIIKLLNSNNLINSYVLFWSTFQVPCTQDFHKKNKSKIYNYLTVLIVQNQQF